jgi:hypothetical protein
MALALGWLVLCPPGLARTQDLAPPEHYRLRLEYERWFATIDAQVRKGGGGLPGTEVDLKEDLGVEDSDSNEFRAVLRLGGRHKLRGSYTSLDFAGDVILERPFLFDGIFFRAGSETFTRVQGALWSAEYQLDLVQSGSGYLGLLLGVQYLDVDSVIVQPEEGERRTGTQRAPVPVLGASGRIYASRISISGEISGLTIGSRGTLYDVQAMARFHITDRLAVGGGYRLLSVRGEDGEDFLRLRDEGFRFGVELSL